MGRGRMQASRRSGTSLHTPRRSRGAQLVLPSTISIASRSCSRASRSPRSLPALSGRCASPPSKLDCSMVRSTLYTLHLAFKKKLLAKKKKKKKKKIFGKKKKKKKKKS